MISLKPFLSSGIAIATGAFGGPAGAFLRTAIIDAMLQKAMIDPDAEDTGISLAQSLTAGTGGALKAASALPMAKSGELVLSGPRGAPGTVATQTSLSMGDKLANLGIQAGEIAGDYLTPPNLDMSLPDFTKQALKFSTGMGAIQLPQTVENIKEGIEDQEAAVAATEAAEKANYDELQRQRVASMLGSFERAGFEPE